MKHLRICCLLMVLSFAVSVLAQGSASAPAARPATPQAQTSPKPAPSIANSIDRQISLVEKEFVEAAEAMPEDKFNFTPASLNIPGSAYKDVRTFAQLIKHSATVNYRFWTILTGEKIPDNIKSTNG
ncbi:MAG: hypothetical protein ACRD4F_03885, partial [Candidatus Angelobacter sp.]